METDLSDRLDELLEKLRRLDRETWDVLDDEVRHYGVNGINAIIWRNFGDRQNSTPEEIRDEKRILRILQGVILDVISSPKRKWRIGTAVSYPEDDPIHWQIDFWPDYEHCYWGAGATFAEALLAAYVAVLEAEAQKWSIRGWTSFC